MKLSRKLLILITILLAASLVVAACSDETQREADEAGDAIEEAGEESGDVVEEAGEDVAEGAEEAGEEIEEGAEEVAEDVEEAGEEVEEDVEAAATEIDEAAEEVGEEVDEAAEEAEEDVEAAATEIDEAAEEVGEEIEEGAEEVEEDVEEASEEIEEEAEEVGEEIEEGAEEVEEDVEEAGEEIEEGAEEVAEDVEEAGEDIEEEVDEIAEESEVHLNSFKNAIFVANQAIGNDTVVIEEVEFDDPAFVVIHADDGEGNPGEVIGTMALEDSEMEEFSVEIDRELVTPTLHVMLHEDSGDDGVFEFGEVEDTDNPVEIDGEVAVVAFEVYMIEPADEAYSEEDNTLTLDAVVTAVSTWIVVYSDEDREDRIGMALVEAGRNKDVVIELDEDAEVGDMVWIVLHDDTGEEGEFEFDDDDEIDDPIVVNLDEVRFSIDLATEETETEADEE